MDESGIERVIFNFDHEREMEMGPLINKDNQIFGVRLLEMNVLEVLYLRLRQVQQKSGIV